MAKKSAIEKNKRRIRMVEKYAPRRAELKKKLKDPNLSDEEFFSLQRELMELPRNSSPTRVRNRCKITGRPRAYLRRYGVSRITFRELASDAKLPGVTKSSF
tara:strand:+ start:145678 stop:145983 length:306 start_codon:yes stop_codon:yes gene_type:complete